MQSCVTIFGLTYLVKCVSMLHTAAQIHSHRFITLASHMNYSVLCVIYSVENMHTSLIHVFAPNRIPDILAVQPTHEHNKMLTKVTDTIWTFQ